MCLSNCTGCSNSNKARSFSKVAGSYFRCTITLLMFLLRGRLISKFPDMSNSPNTATKEAKKPGWQWAAVITYLLLISTPPHLFLVKRPNQVDSLTSTCQGNSPNVAPLPPTILPVFNNGLMPHTENMKIRFVLFYIELNVIFHNFMVLQYNLLINEFSVMLWRGLVGVG